MELGGNKCSTRSVCGVSNSIRRDVLATEGLRAKNLGSCKPGFQVPEQQEGWMLAEKKVWD